LVRPDRIGDLMHVTPLLHALREQEPGVSVDVLARNPALQVLDGNPAVRRVLDTGWDDARIGTAISQGAYQAVVHLFPDRRLIQLCRQIPRSVCKSWIAWPGRHRRVVLHRSRSLKSEALYNADLLLPFFPSLRVEPRPWIFPSAQARARAAEMLPEPRVLLIPGSGHPAGSWPAERFAAVARSLRPELGWALVLWGPGEEDLAARVAKEGRAELAPATDLLLLAALFERAAVVVANETGPMHIAAAAGAPLVVVWDGSRAIRPRRWGHHFRPDIANLDPYDGSSDRLLDRQRRLANITVDQVVCLALTVAHRDLPASYAVSTTSGGGSP
jgi:ADP-heptose:LPS heptosyltransferase